MQPQYVWQSHSHFGLNGPFIYGPQLRMHTKHRGVTRGKTMPCVLDFMKRIQMSIHAKVPAAKGFSTAYLVSPPQLFVVALLVSPEIDRCEFQRFFDRFTVWRFARTATRK